MPRTVMMMVSSERREVKTAFVGTTVIYAERVVSEDGAFKIWRLWGAGAPASNHDDAEIGSEYTITTTGVKYIKTDATTWVVIGTQS